MPSPVAEQHRAAAALVVRRDRQRVERASASALLESGVAQARAASVRAPSLARTGRPSFPRLPRRPRARVSARVGVRDADERVRFLAAFAAHRGPALEPKSCAQAHVGAHRVLATHDLARDALPASRSIGVGFVSRPARRASPLQDFGKARHVHAGFVGREIGYHREFAVVDARSPVDFETHDALYARHAGAIERQPNLGRFAIAGRRRNASCARACASLPSTGRRYQMRRDLGERQRVVRSLFEMRLHDDHRRRRAGRRRSAAAPVLHSNPTGRRRVRRRARSASNASRSSSERSAAATLR